MKLSDGMLVSAITAAGYSGAFAYEAGGAQAFGLPVSLVDLQLMPALFAALLSLSVVLILFQVGDPLLAILTPKADDHPLIAEVRAPIALLVIAVAFWLVGGSSVRGLVLSFLGLMVLGLAFGLLAPLVLFRSVPGYVNKLRVSREVDASVQAALNRRLFASSFGPASLLIVILTGLSYAAGYAGATRQEHFLVTNRQPETVVLKVYGDRAITGELSRKKKQLRRSYRIIRIDEPGLVLREEKVGPLTVLD
jgi:hypothetical protein